MGRNIKDVHGKVSAERGSDRTKEQDTESLNRNLQTAGQLTSTRTGSRDTAGSKPRGLQPCQS